MGADLEIVSSFKPTYPQEVHIYWIAFYRSISMIHNGKDIRGYGKLYAITTFGYIWSYRRKKWLHPSINRHGYQVIGLIKDGIYKQYYVHQLVAKSFIKNPYEYTIVNHLDGCKVNNYVENLEWCTQAENIKHAFKTGLMVPICGAKHYKSKPVRCLDNGMTFLTITEASKWLKVTITNISQSIKNSLPVKGLSFEYIVS